VFYLTEASAASVGLRWTDTTSNETGFRIERHNGSSYVQVATVGANVTSYTDSSLNAGSTYCYQVRAFNSAGVSGPSNQACVNVASTSTSSGGSTSGSTPPPTSTPTSNTGSTTIFAPSQEGAKWTDYKVSMNIRSKDSGSLGVMFRYFDHDNYYRFSWNSYSKLRRLEKIQNGSFQILAEDAVPYVRNQEYFLEILVRGSTIQVQIDGDLIFSIADAGIRSGSIALYSWLNRGSMFDDVLVEDLTGKVLLFDDFNDGNLANWTILDERGVSSGPSVWTVQSGVVVQSSNVGSRSVGQPGTFALY
jgi:hypothetical protein